MKSRLLFLVALWMAISVALLSALAPLGPPSSRSTGSAFNPATTSVVLKARQPATPAAMRVVESDDEGRHLWLRSVEPWLSSLTVLPVALWIFIPALLSLARYIPLTPFASFSRQRARAPPAFS